MGTRARLNLRSAAVLFGAVHCLSLHMRSPVHAAIAQWDFDGSLASSTHGSPLALGAASPAAAPSIVFTNATIAGEAAQVAGFSRGTFFRMTHGLGANGDGALLNQYTLILDVMFPRRPVGWAVLWQTNERNTDDGEWFVNPSRGLGIAGVYGGDVVDGVWNRLALVVDGVSGSLTSFVNGRAVQELKSPSIDGRWALGSAALLFADQDEESAAGLVNAVQLRDWAASSEELLALGGPEATGIPLPPPPTVMLVSPNGGETVAAGTVTAVRWETTAPQGQVRIDLLQGDVVRREIGTTSMAARELAWHVFPFVGDGEDYHVRVAWLGGEDIADESDGRFTITGSLPPPNPLFGRELLSNGGFEERLDSWSVSAGAPVALGAGAKGAPRSGLLFFHGGLNRSGDCVAHQEIDLLAVGFTAAEIDSGAAIDADAFLRNWFGAGTFDDQIFTRVVSLDEEGNELSRLRSIVAADSQWLRRRLVGLVPPGTRRLRIELVGYHRRDRDNDSMADDLSLRLQIPFPVIPPRITKLPMLQDVRQDAMALLWETDTNLVGHAVEWGRFEAGEATLRQVETLQIDDKHFVHRAVLAPLEAETEYLYRVRSGAAATQVFRFRTAPRSASPFRVAWFADNQNGPSILRVHVPHIAAHAPDLVLVPGDTVQNGNLIDEWHTQWFEPLSVSSLAQTVPVVFARGNHDGEHALAYAYSVLPGNEAWFAFDYGNTRFVVLDSEVSTAGSPEQFAWLRAELERPETQAAAFRIAVFHRPPFTDLWDSPGYTGEEFVRNDWISLFESGSVDLVVSGHTHAYSRGRRNGVTYLIVGGGGGALDRVVTANWGFFEVKASQHHYGILDVSGPSLSWRAFRVDDSLLDAFSISSRTVADDGRPMFHRGDSNGDGRVDIGDPLHVLGALFRDGAGFVCMEASDAQNDGAIDISDAVWLLRYLFLDGPPPTAPGPSSAPCGRDSDATRSAGDFGCREYRGC